VALIEMELRFTCLPIQINTRRALRERVADLIAGWGDCGTNRRRAKGRTSPITK
jgi:hypothetical protein